MKKAQLKQIMINISKMERQELMNYSKKAYLAKSDIDKKAFNFIERALDIQMIELSDSTTSSPIIVRSELREGET